MFKSNLLNIRIYISSGEEIYVALNHPPEEPPMTFGRDPRFFGEGMVDPPVPHF